MAPELFIGSTTALAAFAPARTAVLAASSVVVAPDAGAEAVRWAVWRTWRDERAAGHVGHCPCCLPARGLETALAALSVDRACGRCAEFAAVLVLVPAHAVPRIVAVVGESAVASMRFSPRGAWGDSDVMPDA